MGTIMDDVTFEDMDEKYPVKRTGRGPRRSHKMPPIDAPISPYESRTRRPDPYDPMHLERQMRCYELRTRGYTHVQIAQAVGVARQTVSRDIELESERRILERGDNRATQVEQQAGRFEAIISRAGARQVLHEKLAEEEASKPNGGNWRREVILRRLAVTDEGQVLTANDKLADVLGLKAAITVTVDHSLTKAQALLDIVGVASPEQRAELRQLALDARTERLRNVTPT